MGNFDIHAASQISLIGASQSGKTSLAAGLVQSCDRDFAVGFGDNSTCAYLEPRIAGIAQGHWPEATVGENLDISLVINTAGGRSASISFKEYMGERIRDRTYIQKIVGNPQGTMILMNPGMPILRDAVSRVEMLDSLKRMVDYLKKIQCPAVALVVTACDRLSTDLSHFADEFETYVCEIANYLATSGLQWRRFDVTITGALKNQGSPSIAAGANNTARFPFVWLLDRIGRRRMLDRILKCMRRIALAVSAFAAVAAIGCGVEYWRERRMILEFETRVEPIVRNIDTAREKADEAALKRETGCLKSFIDEVKTNESFRFPRMNERREDFVRRWTATNALKRVEYFDLSMKKRLEDASNRGDETSCRQFDDELARFLRQTPMASDELTNGWSGIRPQIRARHDASQLLKWRSKIERCEDKEQPLKDLRGEIGRWEATSEYDGEKSGLLASVDQRLADCKCRGDAAAIADGLSALDLSQTFKAQDGRPIRELLERIGEFEKEHPRASTNVVCFECDDLARKRDLFLKSFSDYYSKSWKLESYDRPALGAEAESFIKAALAVPDPASPRSNLSVRVINRLHDDLRRAVERWNDAQETACRKFIANEIREKRPVTELIDEYEKWYGIHGNSPSVASVDAAVLKPLENYFDEYVKKIRREFWESEIAFNTPASRKEATDGFVTFRMLCLKLAKEKNQCGLTNSWCVKFAQGCADAGRINKENINKAFGQHLVVTQIVAKVSEDGPYGDYLGAKLGVSCCRREWEGNSLVEGAPEDFVAIGEGRFHDYGVKTNDVWETIWTGEKKLLLNPWTDTRFKFGATLDVKGTLFDAKGEADLRLMPERMPYRDGCIEKKLKCIYRNGKQSYTCAIRIYCAFEGNDLFELYSGVREESVAP